LTFSSWKWRERKATIDFDPSSNRRRLALTKLQEIEDGVKIPNLQTSRSKNKLNVKFCKPFIKFFFGMWMSHYKTFLKPSDKGHWEVESNKPTKIMKRNKNIQKKFNVRKHPWKCWKSIV
jgi:hypothetical protein